MLFDEQERETDDPYDYDELIESVATGEDSDRYLIESLESIEFNSLDDNPAVPVNTELLAQYWTNNSVFTRYSIPYIILRKLNLKFCSLTNHYHYLFSFLVGDAVHTKAF